MTSACPVLLLGATLLACSAAVDPVYLQPAPGCPEVIGRPGLTQGLAAARQAWAEAGVEPSACVTEIYYVARADLGADCGFPGRNVDGCMSVHTGRMRLAEYMTPERTAAVIRHEYGHALRHNPGHLECLDVPGDDLMCPAGSTTGEITERDAAFVLGTLNESETVDYAK